MSYKFIFIFIIFLSITKTIQTENYEAVAKYKHKEPIQSVEINHSDINILLKAIIYVESKGNIHAKGDLHLGKNYAAGILQIRPVMVNEVNRILKLKKQQKRFQLSDRYDKNKSFEMFHIWRNYHHINDNWEIIARNWNGGPSGYKKQKTIGYWNKVQKYFKKMEQV